MAGPYKVLVREPACIDERDCHVRFGSKADIG
jgi:hypothetical protein